MNRGPPSQPGGDNKKHEWDIGSHQPPPAPSPSQAPSQAPSQTPAPSQRQHGATDQERVWYNDDRCVLGGGGDTTGSNETTSNRVHPQRFGQAISGVARAPDAFYTWSAAATVGGQGQTAQLTGVPEDDVVVRPSDFNKLTRQEREEGLFDLHGVAETIQEEPTFVQEKLDQLDAELASIKYRPAFEKVLFLNPHYVMNRKFRLSFLRADRFDAAKAAKRMVEHFELKLELFGFERLGRSITMEDLDKDSKELFQCGSHWFLDSYDRSGRKILLYSGAPHIRKSGFIMVRKFQKARYNFPTIQVFCCCFRSCYYHYYSGCSFHIRLNSPATCSLCTYYFHISFKLRQGCIGTCT